MHDLEITWPDGQARFSPGDSPITVGRSPEAAIVLTEPSVSRNHIEFVWTGTTWTAHDSSTHGSFDPIGVRLAPTWTVGTNTTIRVGGVEGVEVRIELLTTRAGAPGVSAVEPPPGPSGFGDHRPEEPRYEAQTSFGGSPGPEQPRSILGGDRPAAPAGPGGYDAPPPQRPGEHDLQGTRPLGLPNPPSSFDAPPAPGGYDNGPGPGPGGYDAPPPQRGGLFDDRPPSSFDAPPAPGGYDNGPGPGPGGYDAPPPRRPGEHDLQGTRPLGLPNPPSSFDAPPAPGGYDNGPGGYDAPPPQRGGLFDAPPAPGGYDSGAGVGPGGFDAPNAPSSSLLDSPPPVGGPGGYDSPAGRPPVGQPPSMFDGPGGPGFDHGGPGGYDQPQHPQPPQMYGGPGGPGFDHGGPGGYDQPQHPQPPSMFDGPGGYDGPMGDGPGRFGDSSGILGPGGDPSFGGGNDPWATGVIHPGAGGLGDMASATSVSTGTIKVSIDDKDYTFPPGARITVGRDPASMVAVDERHSLVSRQHLDITYRNDGWWIEDHSSKGTFIDGKRISKPYQAEGVFMVQLGDSMAGTPMRIITDGEHQASGPPKVLLLAAIGVLALIAIIAVIFALRGGDADAATLIGPELAGSAQDGGLAVSALPSDGPDLASAKQATVLLLAKDGGVGSGFFVDDRLILTNQHVAALAPTLFVAVSRSADDPAVVEFEAETLALHPYLDIALMQVTTDLEGAPVTSSGITPVRIGDSAQLTLGETVYNTGFPASLSLISRDDMGDLLLPPVSATRGEAASFSIWPGCSNPDQREFIPVGSPPGVMCAPEGDIDRGIVITTFSSGQGASGSPVFRSGEVVAVVFAGPEDEANAGRNITTASFRPWLDEILATGA